MRTKAELSVLLSGLFLGQALIAKSELLKEHDICRKEIYGETTLHIRSRYDQSMYMLDQNATVYRNDIQVRKLDYFGDKVFVSPDNKYFLTVSDSAFCKIAYLLFDASGSVIRISFQDSPFARLLLQPLPVNEYPVVYHESSHVSHRIWYNERNPDPKFLIDKGVLQDVTINDPYNQRISLLENFNFVKPIGEVTNIFTYGNVEIRNLNNLKIYEVHFSELVITNSIKKGKYMFEFIEQKQSNNLIELELGVAFLGNKQDADYGSEDKSTILFFDKNRILIDRFPCSFGSGFRGTLKFSRKGYKVSKLPEYIIWSVGVIDVKMLGIGSGR